MGPGQLYQDLQNLIHDLSLVNQISSMIGSLKGNYQVLCDTNSVIIAKLSTFRVVIFSWGILPQCLSVTKSEESEKQIKPLSCSPVWTFSFGVLSPKKIIQNVQFH